mmetsp:Transcript_21766/g.41522  ORF Transcript_21766/g.41522 Transcript_21766/m.41522 type:complete len:997 (-) Transcript_21766:389-3379(-)|eukprot:CAMPEP_0114263516 /NCGR_PEP_ID=MMETSP0058-20121206/22567_1 /TAXON_ID=36894 /ORGANISM="Pyramimonas parkeae, CCMP726" /LENGTH=996 /DNA_ID=CAMNT_0001379833 /DNA_START=408 /DNA_END=3398 /DNA_ORIENTATION=+
MSGITATEMNAQIAANELCFQVSALCKELDNVRHQLRDALQAEARAQADAQRYWELLVNLGVEPPPPPAPQTQGGRTDGDVSWVEEAVDERQCALSADAPSHVDGRSAHRPDATLTTVYENARLRAVDSAREQADPHKPAPRLPAAVEETVQEGFEETRGGRAQERARGEMRPPSRLQFQVSAAKYEGAGRGREEGSGAGPQPSRAAAETSSSSSSSIDSRAMNSKSKTGMFEEFSKRLRVPNLVAGASHSIMDMAAKRKMQLNKKFIRGVAPEEDLASSLPRFVKSKSSLGFVEERPDMGAVLPAASLSAISDDPPEDSLHIRTRKVSADPLTLRKAQHQLQRLRAADDPDVVFSNIYDAFWDYASAPIDPTDPFRISWDLLMMVLLLYITVVLPYRMAFDDEAAMHSAVWWWEVVIDVLFGVDILVNMRTAYTVEGKIEIDQYKILKRYAASWMVIDVVSIFPFDLFLNNGVLASAFKSMRIIKLSRMLKMLKMMKLMRLMKMPHLLSRLELYVNRGMMGLLKFLAIVLVIAHLMACVFYAVSASAGDELNTWISAQGLLRESTYSKYVAALYWSMSTMTTVGYGDVAAVSDMERLLSVVLVMLGATVYAYFMGNMNIMVAAINSSASKKARQLERVDAFLKSHSVPPGISDRVRNYYDYLWQREIHMNDRTIMDGLSAPLRSELVLYIYRDMVENVGFFQNKHPQFITNIMLCLKLEVFAPGDNVITTGEIALNMYFILTGHVGVQDPEGVGVSSKDLFGDPPDSPANSEHNARSKPRTSLLSSDGSHVLTTDRPSPRDGSDSPTSSVKGKRPVCTQLPPTSPGHASVVTPITNVGVEMDAITDVLSAGSHFGEVAVFTGARRSVTMVALTYCELYSLSRRDIDHVMDDWPEISLELSKIEREDLIRMQEEDRVSMNPNISTPQSAPAHGGLAVFQRSRSLSHNTRFKNLCKSWESHLQLNVPAMSSPVDACSQPNTQTMTPSSLKYPESTQD